MKNLLHQRLVNDEAAFTAHYVPIRKQHGEDRDYESSPRGNDEKGKVSRKHGKPRNYGATGAYAR
ncbi:hypothetical protein [Undibacterium sp.]|uniref:hypothetical protein n=1 Tax=Undibacterium sp. TaxID=1914977 RepID=UPI002C9803BD|nr:hypothetical protein [Undibacterium sp.]HTD04827.1 hypothetical protein [Undibacterium sp.]